MRPSEYVRRNVRISPIPGSHEPPVALLGALPEVAVFSSDYPHFEGNADPVAYYDAELAHVPPDVKGEFLGGNISRVVRTHRRPALTRGGDR